MKLSIKTHPKAKKPKIIQSGEGAYEVWVNEAPDKGRANEAVIEAMSGHLKISKSRFAIVLGATSRNKIIEIT